MSSTNSALEKSLEGTTSDKEKVAILLKEVERLQAQVDGPTSAAGAGASEPTVTGLRRRGGGSVNTGAGASVDTAVEKAKEVVSGNQGVPLEVVAGLVVAVFVMTYLFF